MNMSSLTLPSAMPIGPAEVVKLPGKNSTCYRGVHVYSMYSLNLLSAMPIGPAEVVKLPGKNSTC
jgi:hypothetical protein